MIIKYMRREIGEGDWVECTKSTYEYCQTNPQQDTKIIEIKQYVVGFVFDEQRDSVLLIKKLKPEWQAGYLNGIGGKVEDYDETLEAAMCRECREETDLVISPRCWQHVGVMKREDDFETHVFYAISEHINLFESMEAEQVGDFRVVPLLEGKEKTLENIPALLQFCLMHADSTMEQPPKLVLNYTDEPLG